MQLPPRSFRLSPPLSARYFRARIDPSGRASPAMASRAFVTQSVTCMCPSPPSFAEGNRWTMLTSSHALRDAPPT